jgi:hypothetical protein
VVGSGQGWNYSPAEKPQGVNATPTNSESSTGRHRREMWPTQERPGAQKRPSLIPQQIE